MDLYEACKQFMIDHINGVVLDDLPLSERIYRIEHSIRVEKYARMIAEADGYDVTVCSLAGILHDVGKFEDDDNLNHGQISAIITRDFLKTLPLTDKQIDDICYCIAKHCNGKSEYNYDPIMEAEVVSDADKIDKYGVYRIIQALHYNNFDNMSLEEKYEFCNKKILKLTKFKSIVIGTPTGTKLFNNACNIQFDYFNRLKNELQFTLS